MIDTRFGDMARFTSLRRDSGRLNRQISVLAGELASGVVADKARHLRGDLTRLASVSRAMERALVHRHTAEAAGLVIGAQQGVIDDIRNMAQARLGDLTILDQSRSAGAVPAVIDTMAQGFSDLVNRLNTSLAGRTLLAGATSDGPAVVSADTLLDALLAGLPPDTDAADLGTHVAQWFADGGGFDSAGYVGGPPAKAGLALGQGMTTSAAPTARDAAFRTTLAAFATGALLSRGLYATDPESQRVVLWDAAQALGRANAALTGLAARIGVEEAKLAEATSRAVAEHTAMTLARNALIEADPYETATRLEQAMGQLDMVYTLTARLSRLSLVEYLR